MQANPLEAHRFTQSYAQPEDYHFCLDSVLAAKHVAENIAAHPRLSELHVLDLCAGCGIVGLELAHHLRELKQIDFVEIQKELFEPSFRENLRRAGRSPLAFRFLPMSYQSLLTPSWADTYDLIVCNPPYFMPGEGRLSSSAARNRCRFHLDGDPQTLFRSIVHALRPHGHAYVLAKSGRRHGRNLLRDLAIWIAGEAHASIRADIRGTCLLEISKNGR